ncbi:MAG TPA: histidine phosphatase family protein [Baekduia sp.]|uniref:histidine phosphatase family protein n=1 Tax=Baekduia sp. TaxID=2600305 RepID=UPI002D797DD8|nr:histidine phosphatase family protein [Baekduia sp.]HET6506594.1 histidine phosphatase family protein [Baekduia sp.]
MSEIWLVRHAETEWSKAGKHTGRTDVPLTDAGRAHAEQLRARLEDVTFAAVFVSPLGRARETARLAGLGEQAQVRDDLAEYDYGDYEGITTAEIRERRPGWFLWRDGVPNGESPDDVGLRADRILEEAAAAAADGDVALVAHGHVLRVIGARWAGEPASFAGRLALDTGALCRLGTEREVRVIRAWNF